MTGDFTAEVLTASNATLATAATSLQTAILGVQTLSGSIPDINGMAMVYDTNNSVYALACIVTYQEA